MARIVLHRVRLPLLEPFVTAHGTEEHREVVLVESVGDDGTSGWGECSALSQPTYTPEYTDGAWALLRDVVVPGSFAGVTVRIDDAPMAHAAITSSFEDLEARQARRPSPARSHAARHEVSCTAVIGRQGDIDALLAVVATRLDEGYGSIKLKIAPGWDVEPLRAVREAWPGVMLAADANGSYTEADASGVLRSIDALGLVYLEQPLPADDYVGHARLTDVIDTPIALDESIRSAADLDHALSFGLRYVVNLKPSRVGGSGEAQEVMFRAMESSLSMFVGGMLETGVGRAWALGFASWESCDLPTDLGPSSRYFADDITEPIELLPGGRLAIPPGPGIGVMPRPDRLDAVTVDRVELRR